MRYASIDIGTNTLRLLVAKLDAKGVLKPVVYKRIITRLGGGYSENTGIDVKSAERTFEALESFKKTIDENSVDTVFAAATSVVRRARNREWFLKEVLERTGLRISVISGQEEARLAVLGVLSVVGGAGKRLVIDIGGGSTEFIATSFTDIAGAWSLEMGVVHLTEDHLKSDPPSKSELAALEKEIKRNIDHLKNLMRGDNIDPSEFSGKTGTVLAGTAGTITTLAALEQNLEIYDREKINNYILRKTSVKRMYEELSSLTVKERENILSLEKGREDLIIPGSAIALVTMNSFGFDKMAVSDSGLLEGIIMDNITKGGLVS